MTKLEMINYLIELVNCERVYHNLDLESRGELIEFLEGIEVFEGAGDEEEEEMSEEELFQKYFPKIGFHCPRCCTLSNSAMHDEEEDEKPEEERNHYCYFCSNDGVDILKGEELKEMYYDLIETNLVKIIAQDED